MGQGPSVCYTTILVQNDKFLELPENVRAIFPEHSLRCKIITNDNVSFWCLYIPKHWSVRTRAVLSKYFARHDAKKFKGKYNIGDCGLTFLSPEPDVHIIKQLSCENDNS